MDFYGFTINFSTIFFILNMNVDDNLEKVENNWQSREWYEFTMRVENWNKFFARRYFFIFFLSDFLKLQNLRDETFMFGLYTWAKLMRVLMKDRNKFFQDAEISQMYDTIWPVQLATSFFFHRPQDLTGEFATSTQGQWHFRILLLSPFLFISDHLFLEFWSLPQ